MFKLALGIGGIIAALNWEQIKNYISNLAYEKLNFVVQKPSNVKLDIPSGQLRFDFNFSFTNPLPVSQLKIDNMILEIFRQDAVDQEGNPSYTLVTKNSIKDQLKTIIINQGENQQKIQLSVPIQAAASNIWNAIVERFNDRKQRFMIKVSMIVAGIPEPFVNETVIEI